MPTGSVLEELHPMVLNETGQQQLARDSSPEVVSSHNMDSSHVSTHNQSSSIMDTPPLRRLSERINQGIPKPTYEADPKCKHKYSVSEPSSYSRVRYPLNNYVSSRHLAESNKSFVYQLSTVAIPN
ncbi:hypothetical protein ACFX1X_023115 [Malus domestica]